MAGQSRSVTLFLCQLAAPLAIALRLCRSLSVNEWPISSRENDYLNRNRDSTAAIHPKRSVETTLDRNQRSFADIPGTLLMPNVIHPVFLELFSQIVAMKPTLCLLFRTRPVIHPSAGVPEPHRATPFWNQPVLSLGQNLPP